jgi:hypothetical protein
MKKKPEAGLLSAISAGASRRQVGKADKPRRIEALRIPADEISVT